jgi:asparagine synthase (glutamine-hydrolysing)
MCGIAGFVDLNGARVADGLAAIGRAMADAIRHRGPDDDGVWVDPDAGVVVLAHRRLSIVDLSREGHQPMPSATGRYRVVFNGEIYNYGEIRQELDRSGLSPAWRGHSDTEVLLAACEAWGFDDAIRRCSGMFAIALWDAQSRELTLARDRMGEKPLYYGWWRGAFLFGSELKALEAYPGFDPKVDTSAVSAYLRFGYVPAPLSIYADISKLEPGEIIRLDPSRGRDGLRKQRYWRVPLPAPRSIDTRTAVDQLHEVLKTAVRSRMHADVPLGAFLSGGIDSSLVAALMQDAGAGRVRSYSIGFEDELYNEAKHAAAVAKALGTQHEELYVTPQDALDVVPQLPFLYDEPFADSSQIPTHLLSKLTRRHVTVALSGDAGDELFGGYVRYLQARRLQGLYSAVPRPARRLMAAGLSGVSGRLWDWACALGPRELGVALSSDRLGKLASIVEVSGYQEMYGRLVSHWHDPNLPGPALPGWPTPLDESALANMIDEPISWMMYLDSIMYLPDDILVKVDRASMAVSLETRVPFLDHRVVEFAAQVPRSLKIRQGQGKWILRQVLYRYVDRKLVERPKQGFAIPVASWLRGPLRGWAEELLSRSALSESGLLDPVPIRKAWESHLGGRENHHYRLWVILMLQSWLRRARPSSAFAQSA